MTIIKPWGEDESFKEEAVLNTDSSCPAGSIMKEASQLRRDIFVQKVLNLHPSRVKNPPKLNNNNKFFKIKKTSLF